MTQVGVQLRNRKFPFLRTILNSSPRFTNRYETDVHTNVFLLFLFFVHAIFLFACCSATHLPLLALMYEAKMTK